MGSLCHCCVTPSHLSYRFSIFETSATALCGTTGMLSSFHHHFIIISSNNPTPMDDEAQKSKVNHRCDTLIPSRSLRTARVSSSPAVITVATPAPLGRLMTLLWRMGIFHQPKRGEMPQKLNYFMGEPSRKKSVYSLQNLRIGKEDDDPTIEGMCGLCG